VSRYTLSACVTERAVTHAPAVRSLANNNICWGGTMDGMKALIAAFEKMPQLSELKCDRIP
jgi:hypothetical protein